MTTTTVLDGDTAAIVSDDQPYFRWGAVIAGAVVALGVTFFLVTLGSGVGLGLAATPQTAKGAATFLTLGGIYFLAAQAFGFAAGGHLVGRLIGPAVETTKEEEFRAGAHGLVSWALTIAASLVILAFSSAAGGSILVSGAAAGRTGVTAPATGYWVDVMFRPAGNTADTGADKAEANRILTQDMIVGTNDEDTARLARMVASDTDMPVAEAMTRVSQVEAQMHQQAVQAADAARKAVAIFSLWMAFALLFGAVVAVAAAISARWEDDKLNFGWAPRHKA